MLTATVLVHVQVSGCFEVLCIHHGWGEGFGLEGRVREGGVGARLPRP